MPIQPNTHVSTRSSASAGGLLAVLAGLVGPITGLLAVITGLLGTLSGLLAGLLAVPAAVVAVALPAPVAAQATAHRDTGSGAARSEPTRSEVKATRSQTTRSWQIDLWAQAGYQRPSGKFAKNSAFDTPSLDIVETVAEVGPSPVVSGGVDVHWPASDVGVRIGWETTIGAEAVGQIAVCRLVEGTLCREQVAPVDMRGFVSQLRLLRGSPERPLRGVISGGVALRQYTFDVPSCSDRGGTDARIVCDAITDLYRNAGSHVVFRGGVGLQGRASRFVSELTASAGMGRYSGGGGRTNGNWYVDLRLELSAGVRIL